MGVVWNICYSVFHCICGVWAFFWLVKLMCEANKFGDGYNK